MDKFVSISCQIRPHDVTKPIVHHILASPTKSFDHHAEKVNAVYHFCTQSCLIHLHHMYSDISYVRKILTLNTFFNEGCDFGVDIDTSEKSESTSLCNVEIMHFMTLFLVCACLENYACKELCKFSVFLPKLRYIVPLKRHFHSSFSKVFCFF